MSFLHFQQSSLTNQIWILWIYQQPSLTKNIKKYFDYVWVARSDKKRTQIFRIYQYPSLTKPNFKFWMYQHPSLTKPIMINLSYQQPSMTKSNLNILNLSVIKSHIIRNEYFQFISNQTIRKVLNNLNLSVTKSDKIKYKFPQFINSQVRQMQIWIIWIHQQPSLTRSSWNILLFEQPDLTQSDLHILNLPATKSVIIRFKYFKFISSRVWWNWI